MQSPNCKLLTLWKRIFIENRVVSQLAEKLSEFFLDPNIFIILCATCLYPEPDETLSCHPKPRYSNVTLPSSPCKLNTFRKGGKNVDTSKGIQMGISVNMWSDVEWTDMFYVKLNLSELKWSEVKWVKVKLLGIKVPSTLGRSYSEDTWLYCHYFIWVYLEILLL
jgi:hypothetical protein